MESLYKVGDKVLVKDKYDPGCSSRSYQSGFTPEMLNNFGGRICTIESTSSRELRKLANKLPDDGTEYMLEEDKLGYIWASSMFESEF